MTMAYGERGPERPGLPRWKHQPDGIPLDLGVVVQGGHAEVVGLVHDEVTADVATVVLRAVLDHGRYLVLVGDVEEISVVRVRGRRVTPGRHDLVAIEPRVKDWLPGKDDAVPIYLACDIRRSIAGQCRWGRRWG